MAATKADLLKELDGAEDKDELLRRWGELALDTALKTRFSQDHPGKKELVDRLVRHHLSRYYLKSVTIKLMDQGMVKVARVRNSTYDSLLHHRDGLRLILENCAVLLSPTNSTIPKALGKKTFADSFKDCHVADKELSGGVISRHVLVTWEGFEAGMYSYALQVAGLIYLNTLNGGTAFWEEYKQYMTLITDPGELEKEEGEAGKFEVERKWMMEAVVGYTGVAVTNP